MLAIITSYTVSDFFLDDALEEGFILPPGALASVSLPPQLFSTIFDRDLVGVFFALYEEPTLFPPREAEGVTESTLRQAVASSVVAANVGPGLDFSNLEPPVEINLRLTTNFTGFVSRNCCTVLALNCLVRVLDDFCQLCSQNNIAHLYTSSYDRIQIFLQLKHTNLRYEDTAGQIASL